MGNFNAKWLNINDIVNSSPSIADYPLNTDGNSCVSCSTIMVPLSVSLFTFRLCMTLGGFLRVWIPGGSMPTSLAAFHEMSAPDTPGVIFIGLSL